MKLSASSRSRCRLVRRRLLQRPRGRLELPRACAPPSCDACICGPGEWSTCPAACNLPPGA